MFKKWLFLVIIFIFSKFSFGNEILLSSIQTDDKEDSKFIYKIYIKNNEYNEVISFYRKKFSKFSGRLIDMKEYSIEKLANQGITLEERKGISVVTLRSNNFHRVYGGDFSIKYLKNWFKSDYKTINIKLAPPNENSGQWELITKRNLPIKKMFLYVNKKPLVGVVGIKSIKFFR